MKTAVLNQDVPGRFSTWTKGTRIKVSAEKKGRCTIECIDDKAQGLTLTDVMCDVPQMHDGETRQARREHEAAHPQAVGRLLRRPHCAQRLFMTMSHSILFQSLPLWMRSGDRYIRDEECYAMAQRELLTVEMITGLKTGGMLRNESYEGRFDAPKGEIEVTDMLYSIGAEHYYCTVKLPRFDWHSLERPNLCCSARELILPTREVSMSVVLTEKEIRRVPEKYKHYRAGERYEGFNTPREALFAAHQWIKSFTQGLTFTFDTGRDYDGLGDLLKTYPVRYPQNWEGEGE